MSVVLLSLYHYDSFAMRLLFSYLQKHNVPVYYISFKRMKQKATLTLKNDYVEMHDFHDPVTDEENQKVDYAKRRIALIELFRKFLDLIELLAFAGGIFQIEFLHDLNSLARTLINKSVKTATSILTTKEDGTSRTVIFCLHIFPPFINANCGSFGSKPLMKTDSLKG